MAHAGRGARARATDPDLWPGRRHQPPCSHRPTHGRPGAGGAWRPWRARAIDPLPVRAACPGAGIFLLAEYETLAASFSALGRQGKPSEAVADEAVAALREHHVSKAAVELHLADQLLLPLASATG